MKTAQEQREAASKALIEEGRKNLLEAAKLVNIGTAQIALGQMLQGEAK